MSEVFDYAALQETATELIAFFGRDVTLRKRSTIPTNATREWEGRALDTSSDIATKCAFVDFTTKDRDGLSSITVKDKRALVGVQSVELDVEWEIIDSDATVWKIVAILDHVKPGPLTVLYDLQVRI